MRCLSYRLGRSHSVRRKRKWAVYHRDGFFATNLTKPRTTCLPLAAARYLELANVKIIPRNPPILG